MDVRNRLLFHLAKGILARNGKFKNRHKRDSCYIFGNGASLKTMDLARFSDRISIGCNLLCVHKDFRALDMWYYLVPEPFFFYPVWDNRYTGEIQINHLGACVRKGIALHKDISIFTSLSNIFGLRGANVFYLHHFGTREPSVEDCEMDGKFSFMKGALHSMIGTAIYMGFDRAILVGCDYTFSPQKDKRFFEPGTGITSNRFENVYARLFEEASKRIDLMVITDDGAKSDALRYEEYCRFANTYSTYRENTELVRGDYLDLLERAARKGQ